MGDFGINLDLLREVYGIECLAIDDRSTGLMQIGAIFQEPDHEFMVFPLVKEWIDGTFMIYALYLREGIGSRLVVPDMSDLSLDFLRQSPDADFVGHLGPTADASTLAEYIKGYIEKGEWSKWLRATP